MNKYASLTVAAAFLACALGCSSGGEGGDLPTAPPPGGPPPPPPPPGAAVELASGSFTLTAATNPGEPGNHEVLRADHVLTAVAAGTANQRLVLELEDVSRPLLACGNDEPESGCATVDWSADPAEPQVPGSGVFDNRVSIELVSGVRDFYLSRTRQLAEVPDVADPNREHTAIGGFPERWEGSLPTDLLNGGSLELRVVMTKWQLPAVRIGYRILLEEI